MLELFIENQIFFKNTYETWRIYLIYKKIGNPEQLRAQISNIFKLLENGSRVLFVLLNTNEFDIFFENFSTLGGLGFKIFKNFFPTKSAKFYF